MNVSCAFCGRKRLFETEGRTIDGSWADDDNLDKSYYGQWVCSYACYDKLIGSS